MLEQSGQAAIAYYRTSSAANVEGDSEQRQRIAVHSYAHRAGLKIVAEFYDAAVSGADAIGERRGFREMLAALAELGVAKILVETANRFARDLIVQETGWRYLHQRGVQLIAVDSPNAFLDDTPTAVLIRQVLGAVAQFEKAALVAKLRAARERCGRKGGRKPIEVTRPEATKLVHGARGLPLRMIADGLAKLGHVTRSGKPLHPQTIANMLHARVE